MTTTTEAPADTLARIRSGFSQNDARAIEAFESAGYANPIPRVNILTYKAWRAVGRQVRKGEKGVKVPVVTGRDEDTGRTHWRNVALSHIDQTTERD